MSLKRYSHWVVLALLLLDVAPTAPISSCGSRPEPEMRATTWFEVWASDCSCVPAAVEVYVDGSFAGSFSCGTVRPAEIPTTPGAHVVTATSGAVTWPPRTVHAAQGEITRVELGCPTR